MLRGLARTLYISALSIHGIIKCFFIKLVTFNFLNIFVVGKIHTVPSPYTSCFTPTNLLNTTAPCPPSTVNIVNKYKFL